MNKELEIIEGGDNYVYAIFYNNGGYVVDLIELNVNSKAELNKTVPFLEKGYKEAYYEEYGHCAVHPSTKDAFERYIQILCLKANYKQAVEEL